MSEYAEDFIRYLEQLNERDRGALAILRHSAAFDPGAYPPAYPYVERFVASERHAKDASRLALYVVAGLYAQHPKQGVRSLAASFGELMRQRESPSIEKRFIALLGANAETLPNYLRQIIGLLAADDIGLDYVMLLDDLSRWLNPHIDPEWRDRIRQRWARDFYQVLEPYPVAHHSEPAI